MTLFLLDRYGGETRSGDFYADRFADMFPAARNEVPPTPYRSADALLRDCYVRRALIEFGEQFGLVRLARADSGDAVERTGYMVTALPLLDQVVEFKARA